MRRAALAVAIALLAAGVPRAHAAAIRHGESRRYEIAAPSLHDAHRAVRGYLPPSYGDAASGARRYPVVVLLHGWPGSDGNWLSMGHAAETADTLMSLGRVPEAILVFPNGAGAGLLGRSLWMNAADGRSRLEDFLARDLPRWVDSTFRTDARAERRALIGLSDGGTAAAVQLLRHGDVYGDAAAHSATFRLKREFGMGGLLGDEPGATRWLEDSSPAVLIERGLAPPAGAVLYFDCGANDESLADNRAFDRALTARGIAHEFREYPGTHDWSYWRRHLVESLEAVTARWK